jgi:hypothetical protein
LQQAGEPQEFSDCRVLQAICKSSETSYLLG